MLVFGDVEEARDAAALHRGAVEALSRVMTVAHPSERHAASVDALLRASDLLRAMLDAKAAAAGSDGLTGLMRQAPKVLLPIAKLVRSSWTGEAPSAEEVEVARRALAELQPSGIVASRTPEGYGFYAVYPEAYAEAARRSGLGPGTRVIGIRSIGLSLAAVVADALGADDFVSVRPVGHPFNRQLSISDELAARILERNPEQFAVVDEGPGLSGSSFAAVADWLMAHGVDQSRIHFFPGHAGEPGSEAGADRLALWRTTPRHHVPIEQLLLTGKLQSWVPELVGPLDGPLVDLSWGAWRPYVRGGADAPLAPSWERRKFLATAGGATWLVKFAGLGEMGEIKLRLARRLHAAGFGPQVAGLCHGFLVERWIEGQNLLDLPVERGLLVDRLAAYLAFRAGLPAAADSGAPLEKLSHAALYNAREALGEAATTALAPLLEVTPELTAAVRRVETDGRLHRWEWLLCGSSLMKTDAVDHARTHDFIGRQDITWDVAGAIVEFDLDTFETERLLQQIAGQGVAVDPGLLGFMLPAYLAYQLGAWTMWTGAESPLARRYADRLAALASAQSVTSALTNPSGLSRVASSAVPS